MRVRENRGIMLVSAIVISLVMMMWVVAALLRTKSQTTSVLHSHLKSRSFYLAKSAVSCALFNLNANAAWAGQHNSQANGWTAVTGASCWVEAQDTQLVLRCQAEVDGQRSNLTVPLRKLEDKGTEVLSVMTTPAGQDLIAKNAVAEEGWDPIPPVPGMLPIRSVTGAGNGDLYVVTDPREADGCLLWRYREGRGWIELQDPPSEITDVAVARTDRLVAAASSGNKLLVLPLNASMDWQEIAGPSAMETMTQATIPSGNPASAYALGKDGSGAPVLSRYDFPVGGTPGNWVPLTLPPEAVHFSPTGTPTRGGAVPNLDGGLGVGPSGEVYVASNPPGEPSVIYKQTGSTWEVFPPVRYYSWAGDQPVAGGLSTTVKDLRVDRDGYVWVQAQEPGGTGFSNVRLDSTN